MPSLLPWPAEAVALLERLAATTQPMTTVPPAVLNVAPRDVAPGKE